MRLVSLCPSNTELAAYLGLTDYLVGVDDFSDWPESIQSLPRLGPDLSINMEKVSKLKPDLVLASLSVPGMEKNVEALKQMDIPFIVLEPNSLNDIKKDMLLLGEAVSKEQEAKRINERFDEVIHFYKSRSAKLEPVRLYWEWWPKPVFTPGGGNWLSTISRLAGGVNIFEHKKEPSLQITWEEIREQNPDHICLAWVGVQTSKINPKIVRKRPNWKDMRAVQNGRIHILEEPLYCRPSPRLLIGLKKLASLLHPEHFPPVDHKDPLYTSFYKR
ncbi:cobalamin-binding protein [Bacillus sp. FJAT-44742]|uniref:cobalamin-binding protein n=1 Tax=Bacillus sp. FJAT-44742 TaxID=2014005 RepID=UPI000C242820|nr:cobalamin-binding protein [Bacillus sp. FJAT-44742]